MEGDFFLSLPLKLTTAGMLFACGFNEPAP
jgi:hypothetical protein